MTVIKGNAEGSAERDARDVVSFYEDTWDDLMNKLFLLTYPNHYE
jgi:hypothetical protein